jgi:hypothetical protein
MPTIKKKKIVDVQNTRSFSPSFVAIHTIDAHVNDALLHTIDARICKSYMKLLSLFLLSSVYLLENTNKTCRQ